MLLLSAARFGEFRENKGRRFPLVTYTGGVSGDPAGNTLWVIWPEHSGFVPVLSRGGIAHQGKIFLV